MDALSEEIEKMLEINKNNQRKHQHLEEHQKLYKNKKKKKEQIDQPKQQKIMIANNKLQHNNKNN